MPSRRATYIRTAMSDAAAVAIIARTSDCIADALAQHLLAQGVALLRSEPHQLASVRVTLDSAGFVAEGKRLSGIVWRVSPGTPLSAEYVSVDQAFADTETAAVWLGAMHSPSVWAINRYDATAWYGGCTWPVWRALLRQCEVPVSALHLGEPPSIDRLHRVPFSTNRVCEVPSREAAIAMGIATTTSCPAIRSIAVCGTVLTPVATRTMRAAAAALDAHGVALAELTIDQGDRVMFVDDMPDIEDDAMASAIAERLTGRLYAGMRAG